MSKRSLGSDGDNNNNKRPKKSSKINRDFWVACQRGHIRKVTKMIDSGEVDINFKLNDATPIYIAAEKGHWNVVKKLIEVGADINEGRWDISPLYKVTEFKRIDLVKLLIEKGADLNKTNYNGTPIWLASRYESPEIFNILLKAGADVNATDTRGMTSLNMAIKSHDRWPNQFERLIKAGADVNKPDYQQSTPLFIAVHYKRVDMVKAILSNDNFNKDNFNKKNMNHDLPFNYAIGRGSGHVNYEICKLLLEAGADPNRPDGEEGDEVTPLYDPCENRDIEAVTFLLDNGADINKPMKLKWGDSPLHYSTTWGADGPRGQVLFNLILERNANVNVTNNIMDTPLHQVCWSGDEAYERDIHVQMAIRLIEAGADVNKVNNAGATPLWIASRDGMNEIVEALIEAGADVNKAVKNNYTGLITEWYNDDNRPFNDEPSDNRYDEFDGSSPLLAAAKGGHLATVGILLSVKNIDINNTNSAGFTAKDICQMHGNRTQTIGMLNRALNFNSREVKLPNSIGDPLLSCAICAENWKPCDDYCKLNCGHIFHTKCIKQWYIKNNNASNRQCVICRAPITSIYNKNIASAFEIGEPDNNGNITLRLQISNMKLKF
jgi:uncharacterized protein